MKLTPELIRAAEYVRDNPAVFGTFDQIEENQSFEEYANKLSQLVLANRSDYHPETGEPLEVTAEFCREMGMQLLESGAWAGVMQGVSVVVDFGARWMMVQSGRSTIHVAKFNRPQLRAAVALLASLGAM